MKIQYKVKTRLQQHILGRKVEIILLCLCMAAFACGQQKADGESTNGNAGKDAVISQADGRLADSLAGRMAQTVMRLWKDPIANKKSSFSKWSYDEGVVLKGFEGRWLLTGDASYYNYIQNSIADFVQKDGHIRTYDSTSLKLDDINTGKLILTLYRVTEKPYYWQAATSLRNQLSRQPRTYDGGFWHKKIYPNQMWLDGLYMAAPFYAEYALLNGEDTTFNDIGKQFVLMEKHSIDAKTGLLYHGWDASKEQAWADKTTGVSKNFWGRAVGWYAMAIVDALDYFPENQPYRDSMVDILGRIAKGVVHYQDKESHLWWQVLDKGGEKDNYLEASASCMFVYALAKGVRKGYLPEKYLKAADAGFKGIVSAFIKDNQGQLELSGTCAVAGLGGKPYRDGTYDYYVKQRPVINDAKGIGAFLLAANEIQMGAEQFNGHANGQQKVVLLDNYFNHETKKNYQGLTAPFHYVWQDRANSGFSLWGDVFHILGAKTSTLTTAPSLAALKKAGIYLIVDPDTEKETAQPNFVQSKDVDVIKAWVKEGGMLVLLANDTLNCEFTHFNTLADAFGLHFDGNSLNRVQGHQFEQGAVAIPENSPIFKNTQKVYIKEVSTLKLDKDAEPVLKLKDGEVIGALSRYGKGTVLAIGDPWLYNEYVDGRKLPGEFQNYQAMTDLSKWLLNQVKTTK